MGELGRENELVGSGSSSPLDVFLPICLCTREGSLNVFTENKSQAVLFTAYVMKSLPC